MKKYASAVQDCIEARRLDPKNIKVYIREIKCLLNLGLLKDASKLLDSSKSMAQNDVTAKREIEILVLYYDILLYFVDERIIVWSLFFAFLLTLSTFLFKILLSSHILFSLFVFRLLMLPQLLFKLKMRQNIFLQNHIKMLSILWKMP